jgi:hypothetical protein
MLGPGRRLIEGYVCEKHGGRWQIWEGSVKVAETPKLKPLVRWIRAHPKPGYARPTVRIP